MLDYNMKPFRFWCQKVLPLVYDDSLSYMELLCRVVNYLNHIIEDINGIPDYINQLISEDKLKELMSELLDELREQIARANEGTNTTASYDRATGDLVWLDGKLVRVTRDMLAGDRYVEDTGVEGVTGNFVYTSIEMELSRVKEALTNEVTNRQTADAQLQANIESEAETRVQADIQLQTNIDNEVLAREQADTQLHGNIDNEVLAREQADTQLQGNIDNEVLAREQADGQLQSSINSIKTVYNIIYDVTKYGAVGDNVNDDTNAINNTIELASNAGGGIVFLPKGNYKITTPILIKDGISLVGEGTNLSVIHSNFYSSTANLVNATDLTCAINMINADIRNCEFSNFGIVSDVELSTTNVCVGILGGSTIAKYNSAIATFKNIKINGFTTGIDGRGEPTGVGIFDSIFDNVFIANSKWFAMICSGSQNLYNHCRFTSNANGIALWHMNDESFDGGLFDNCIFIQNGYDITIRPDGGNRPVVFNNTWFEQSTNGIINVPFANTRSLALKFVGCMLQSNTASYDMFIASNITYGIIVLDCCTLYQVTSTTNNNVTLPTASTSLASKITNCVKVSYTGTYTVVNS